MNVTLRQLQCFRQVAEHASFSKAAERIGLSQPALSATIRKLEDAVGVRVFDRTTRQVVLTPEGEELLRLATRMVDEFESVSGDLQDYLARRRGRVVVAALPTAAAVILPPVLARYRRDHPGIDVRLDDALHDRILEAVRSGSADFGVTVAPADGDEFRFQPLLADRFVLVCRPEHPLAARGAVTWAELADQPMIAMSRTTSVRQLIDTACARAGVGLPSLYEASHLATIAGLVEAGIGIAALPSLALPLLRFAELTAVPIEEPVVERSIGIVRRPARSPSVAARGLLDLLLDVTGR
ncbi:LysR family transcriptional regulator [Azospirillum sp. ST 5-10]|uniref:LysR family transcriptional regulator n=1 Tax=unclassified Azospirillum TaxID=2630922 RepID=UPI003F49CCBD